MSLKIKDRSAAVVLVEPAQSLREGRVEVLKSAGFKDIDSFASLKDALARLEQRPVDWLITPLQESGPVNAMQVLKLCEVHPQLKGLLVSLLVEGRDTAHLFKAFDLGMLSYHKYALDKQVFKFDMQDFLERFANFKFNGTAVAAHNLRELLIRERMFDVLLKLETSLQKYFPVDARQLLNTAFAQLQCKRMEPAVENLRLALALDPASKARVAELQNLFGVEMGQGSGGSILGVKECLIIDADVGSVNALKKVLEEYGTTVKSYADGKTAWEAIKGGPAPALIIMEWKLRGISSTALIQRLRLAGMPTPFVVTSQDLVEGDLAILREMEVADLIPKPYDPSKLASTLIRTVRRIASGKDPASIAAKLRQLLEERRFEEAGKVRDEGVADKEISQGWKYQYLGEFAFATGDFEGAKGHALNGLKAGGDQVVLLNLLGKTFMKLRDFTAAVRCFDNAKFLSPNNVERLCNIAESQIELGQVESAKESLEDVKHIDSESTLVQETQAKVAMASGDIETAREQMEGISTKASLVSYMNNRGVSMTRSGQVDEGIAMYEGALKSIAASDVDLKAQVLYNLGLAYCRANRLGDAERVLDECGKLKGSKVQSKAASLLDRSKKASASGQKLALMTEEKPMVMGAVEGSRDNDLDMPSLEAIMTVAACQPMDRCCYMLFSMDEKSTEPRVRDLYKTLPPFKPHY